MASRAAPNPGQPPSRQLGQKLQPVQCPHANDPAPPPLPEVIPPGAAKPAGVLRGEGEKLLMSNLERRRNLTNQKGRIDARLASYGPIDGALLSAGSNGPSPIPSLVEIPDTTELPYRQVALLEIYPMAGQTLQGSGWLAAPNLIVTAGHCVFQRLLNSWARTIRVHLAVNGTGQEPYEVQESHNLQSVSQWTDQGNEAFDIGAIILPNAFEGPPGNFGYDRIPTNDDLRNLLITLLGYPSEGTPDSETMWGDQDFLTGISPTQIYYGFETRGGMSGGPVFYTLGSDRYIVGIHNYGGGSLGNYATRLTAAVQKQIDRWGAMAASVLG
jgi:V8-like Glu-specific endopeptidase